MLLVPQLLYFLSMLFLFETQPVPSVVYSAAAIFLGCFVHGVSSPPEFGIMVGPATLLGLAVGLLVVQQPVGFTCRFQDSSPSADGSLPRRSVTLCCEVTHLHFRDKSFFFPLDYQESSFLWTWEMWSTARSGLTSELDLHEDSPLALSSKGCV